MIDKRLKMGLKKGRPNTTITLRIPADLFDRSTANIQNTNFGRFPKAGWPPFYQVSGCPRASPHNSRSQWDRSPAYGRQGYRLKRSSGASRTG